MDRDVDPIYSIGLHLPHDKAITAKIVPNQNQFRGFQLQAIGVQRKKVGKKF